MRRLLTRITAVFDGAAGGKEGKRTDPARADTQDLAALPAAGANVGSSPSGLLFRTGLRLPRRLDLAFDRHLVGEGWHNPETSGNLPFRWMGLAENATIWLAVDRSVFLAIDLAIFIIIKPDCADQISVSVGEPPEPVAYERTAEGLSFVLPPAPDQAGLTRITLWAPGLVPGADPRHLSIACSHLRVRPLDAGLAEGHTLVLRTALSRHLPDRGAAARAAAREGCEVQHLE